MSNEDMIFGIILVLGAVSAFYLSFPLQRYLDKAIYGENYEKNEVDAAIEQLLVRNDNVRFKDPVLQALVDSDSAKLEELANEAKSAASTKKNSWDLAMPDCNNFYDPENLEFEAVQILNEHILFILIQFIFVFCWLALNVLTHYRRWVFKWQETLLGGFVSTSLVDQNPQIILCSILPSFLDVLYFFEDHYVPKIAVKAIGHQWSLERLHNPIGPTEGGISFLCSSIQNDPCSSG